MLRTIKAIVAMMLVLALAACSDVTGPIANNGSTGYDGNGPQTAPDEIAPGDDDEGGGVMPNHTGGLTSNRQERSEQNEVAPGSEQDGGGSDEFPVADPNTEVDDDLDIDQGPEGGEHAPTEDGEAQRHASVREWWAGWLRPARSLVCGPESALKAIDVERPLLQ